MSDNTKSSLIALGAEALASALIELTEMSPEAQDLVERMLATPEEKLSRIRDALKEIRAMEGEYDGEDVAELADELTFVLDDIEAGVEDPCLGISLMAEFFETDETVFDACNDADGDLSDIYTDDARDLFTSFACRCKKTEKITDTLFRLTTEDPFGVRGSLVDNAWEFLSPAAMKKLTKRFQTELDAHPDENESWHLERCLHSLTDQLEKI